MRIVDRNQKEQEIIQAAIQVFSERGFEKSSVSQIADRAGIATGGIYNYFRNKEHLFEQCYTHITAVFTKGIKEILRGENRIYNTVLFALRFFKANPSFARIVLLETKNFAIRFPESKALHIWHNQIAEVILRGFRDELPEITTREKHRFYVSLMLGGVESVIVLWLFKPEIMRLSAEEIAEHMTMILRGGRLQ